MTELERQLSEAVAAVQALGPRPKIGVVLGSGLGGFAESLQDLIEIPAASIPHLPASTVKGHSGTLCLGRVDDFQVACLKGRVHAYEGYAMDRVVFGVLLLHELGCKVVLLTNAAGGIADRLQPGSLMLIEDHLNVSGRNPLVGPNLDPYPRFVDLTGAYDGRVARAALRAAAETDARLETGVYAFTLGPSYETPAEVRMLKALGADAVGMSTVPEVIALRHRGARVGAISLITNRAAGLTRARLDHDEVMTVASRAEERFVRLLGRWIMLVGGLLQG